MGPEESGHLYRRARSAKLGRTANGPVKVLADDHVTPGRAATDREADELWAMMSRTIAGTASAGRGQISALWLYRMLYSSHPLREKLTLFWHNHFATSNVKVQNAGYMLGQYELMRRHAQGNFRTLLTDISRDPAMMIWLDTTQSQRDRPNENYARELMELFSLGVTNARRPGQRNYTEDDIRQAARFTGLHREWGPVP